MLYKKRNCHYRINDDKFHIDGATTAPIHILCLHLWVAPNHLAIQLVINDYPLMYTTGSCKIINIKIPLYESYNYNIQIGFYCCQFLNIFYNIKIVILFPNSLSLIHFQYMKIKLGCFYCYHFLTISYNNNKKVLLSHLIWSHSVKPSNTMKIALDWA